MRQHGRWMGECLDGKEGGLSLHILTIGDKQIISRIVLYSFHWYK